MRLDLFLFSNNFSDSRNKAQQLILDSRVTVNGKVVTKTSFDVSENDNIEITACDEFDFVGRGGKKLEHSFKCFDYDVKDKICLDIGASTGGFTQCLLLHGAGCVYAVDSGKDQLAASLKEDSRVISIESFNAKNLSCDVLNGTMMDIVVMDVSFISQKLLYPAILRVAKKGADVITLIKPQFEAGKQNIGKKGIVKDEKVRKKVIEDIIEFAKQSGFTYIAHTDSPIAGGDGNKEYLLHLKVN
ncbi:MAG: TlyA family RNA methyltransferase [Ruminococcaceae bacterium]|nr:TlyA family RNA methyltransferase [Oscillospiraceae bacterium]